MGMNLYWEPVGRGKTVNVVHRDAVRSALEATFPDGVIQPGNVRTLAAMDAASSGEPAYKHLIQIVQNNGPVKISWES